MEDDSDYYLSIILLMNHCLLPPFFKVELKTYSVLFDNTYHEHFA
jgi:hypothetical protein